MALNSLQLRNFRNYRELSLQLHPEITVFTGRNGIGKTSILEAISILGSGRTFRNGKNRDLIHKGDEVSFLSGAVSQRGLETQIKVRIYPQGKKIFLDEKLARSTSVLLELLPHAIKKGIQLTMSQLKSIFAEYQWTVPDGTGTKKARLEVDFATCSKTPQRKRKPG